MAKTYYLSNTDITAGVYDTLAESAPASLSEDQSWKVGKLVNYWFILTPDTTDVGGTADPLPTAFQAKGYRTTNTVSGQFAAGTWTLYFKVKSGPSYYAQYGKVEFRLWRSTNADGSGATQITAGWNASTTITFTAADQYQTGSIAVSLSGVTLTDEYLFLEVLWHNENSGGNNNARVLWVDNEGSAERLEAPTITLTKSVAGAVRPDAQAFKKTYPPTKTASFYPAGVLATGYIFGRALVAGLSFLGEQVACAFIKYGTAILYGTGYVYHQCVEISVGPILKALYRTFSPIGTLFNKTSTSMAATFDDMFGEVFKKTGKSLLGRTFTPVGTLFKKAATTLLGRTFTPVGTLFKKVITTLLSRTFTPVGTLLKKVLFHLAASLSWVADLATQKISGLVQKSLEAGMQFTGVATKLVGKSLVRTFTPVGQLFKSVLFHLAGVIRPEGVLTTLKAFFVALSAGLQFTGEAFKKVGKTLLGRTFTPVGTLVRLVGKKLAAAIQPVGQVFKRMATALAAGLQFGGVLSALKKAVLALSAGFQPVGQLFKRVGKSLTAGIQPIGQVFKQFPVALAASIQPVGQLFKRVGKALIGRTFTPAGQLFKLVSFHLAAGMSWLADLVVQKAGLTLKFLEAGLSFTGAATKGISFHLARTFQTAGRLAKGWFLSLAGAIRPAGVLSTLRLVVVALSAGLSFTGSLFKAIGRGLVRTFAPVGQLFKLTATTLIRTFSTVGTLAAQKLGAILKSLEAGISFTGEAVKLTRKGLVRTLSTVGSLFRLTMMQLVASLESSAVVVTGRQFVVYLSGVLWKQP